MTIICFFAGAMSSWEGAYVSAQPALADTSSLHSPVMVEKFLPSSVELGRPFSATIVVQNRSTNPVEKVTVIEELNTGTKMIDSTPKPAVSEKRLIWQVGRMQPGQKLSIKCRFQIDAAVESKTLRSTVHAVFQAYVSSSSTCKITAPSLQLDIEGPETTFIGQLAQLNIVLKNNSSASANELILESLLDSTLIHRFGSELEYSIETLKPGQARVVPLVFTPKSVGSFSIAVRIKGPASATITKTRKIKVVPSPIKITREAPSELFPEVIAAFRLRISNNSPRTMEDVQFALHLPKAITFLRSPLKAAHDDDARVVRWNLGKLASGASRVVIWNGSAGESGEAELRAAVWSAGELLFQSQMPIQVRPISALNKP